jgi:hypothetical protein
MTANASPFRPPAISARITPDSQRRSAATQRRMEATGSVGARDLACRSQPKRSRSGLLHRRPDCLRQCGLRSPSLRPRGRDDPACSSRRRHQRDQGILGVAVSAVGPAPGQRHARAATVLARTHAHANEEMSRGYPHPLGCDRSVGAWLRGAAEPKTSAAHFLPEDPLRLVEFLEDGTAR